MHDAVYLACSIWMTALLLVTAAAVVGLRLAAARILALDTLTLLLAAILILHASLTGSAHSLDAALVLVLLAFISTLAAARYHGEGRLF